MDTYNSGIFGEIQMPESFVELMEFPTQLSKIKGKNIMLWRGQGDISWPIDSGAYRRLVNSGQEQNELYLSSYEKGMLKSARHKGYGTNEGLPISDMELLAKLQHHGAATRLVDFSKSMLVALWFCLNSNIDNTGLITGVHTYSLGGLNYEGYLEKRDYKGIMKELSTEDLPVFMEPPVVSKRIAAQHAVFLYSGISNEVTGSLILPKDKGGTLFIAISPELKKEAKKILIESFDIRTETLFPDFDGFASLVNNISSDIKSNNRW
ncbi:FRG domain-containing protein [Peribacillus sp. NPDC058002]|uniref:FRG domain-containing protein n=1 Tax=Peribacillus sp. NPDC058002 TaxID=3346301 RepID=UPI0036DA55E6